MSIGRDRVYCRAWGGSLTEVKDYTTTPRGKSRPTICGGMGLIPFRGVQDWIFSIFSNFSLSLLGLLNQPIEPVLGLR